MYIEYKETLYAYNFFLLRGKMISRRAQKHKKRSMG